MDNEEKEELKKNAIIEKTEEGAGMEPTTVTADTTPAAEPTATDAPQTAQNETVESEKESVVQKVAEISKKAAKATKNNMKTWKFSSFYENLQGNIPALIITIICALIVMLFAALAVFFANVQGEEKVLVPNVVGKQLEDALLEMQVKELYPKINLRYSETPGDEGQILEQSPEAGSIVKGYSRVSLVVSRGVVVDEVGDYVGQKIDDLELKLQTLFAGQTRPLIVLASPEYKPDVSEAGTILEQDPPAGTSISEPIQVQLIVSRGPQYENTRPPMLVGQSVNDLLSTITRSKIVFDITAHTAGEDEIPGTVVSQQTFDKEFIPNWTHMTVEMAMPDDLFNDNIYGIFTAQLAEYPYPVPMKIEAKPAEGDSYTIVSFSHPGGNLTIPYAVLRGTTLVLTVADKVITRQVVN